MKVVQRNVYVADSGKEFETEEECLDYELAVRLADEFSWVRNMDYRVAKSLVEWIKENT